MEVNELIPKVMVLFALSMISERVANLFKLYIPFFFRLLPATRKEDCNWNNPNYRFQFVLIRLDLRQTDPAFKLTKDRIIMFFSLIAGFIIAGSFSRFLIQHIPNIALSNDETTAFWQKIFWTLGFGVLFSFGSKFWHDILDLLLIIKNTRRRLEDANPEDFHSAKEFQRYLSTSNHGLVSRAIKENDHLLKSWSDEIKIIQAGYHEIGGIRQECVEIYLEGTEKEGMPQSLKVTGSSKAIPVYYIENLGTVKVHSFGPGDSLDIQAPQFSDSSIGKLACKVTSFSNNENFLLTCGHVLTKRTFNVLAVGDPVEVNGLDMEVEKFRLQNNHDYALIKAPNIDEYHNDITDNQQLKGIRALTGKDNGTLRLKALVNRNDEPMVLEAKLNKIKTDGQIKVEYENDKILEFDNLITIKRPNRGGPVTIAGDSGTIFYDLEGQAVGMVLGADKSFTYLMNMRTVTNNLKCKIAES